MSTRYKPCWPSAWAGKMDYIRYYDSPLGRMVLLSDGKALTGLDFEGQHFSSDLAGKDQEKDLPVLTDTCRWLDIYFQGRRPDFMPAISLKGTPFRQVVWDILRTIPYGQTTTYGEIAAQAARKMGKARMSAQAAGGAVGHNPIAILVPCHRVIGRDGRLTGYAGGVWRKEYLLALEGVQYR